MVGGGGRAWMGGGVHTTLAAGAGDARGWVGGSAQTTRGALGPVAQHRPSVSQTVTKSPLLRIHVGIWKADSVCAR